MVYKEQRNALLIWDNVMKEIVEEQKWSMWQWTNLMNFSVSMQMDDSKQSRILIVSNMWANSNCMAFLIDGRDK